MKFRIQVDARGMDPWWEEYDKDIDDMTIWAEQTVKDFNDTLRPFEVPRRLLTVEKLGD